MRNSSKKSINLTKRNILLSNPIDELNLGLITKQFTKSFTNYFRYEFIVKKWKSLVLETLLS